MYEWMSDAMQQANEVLQDFSFDWGFRFNAPATDAELNRAEAELALSLPESYRYFLSRHNGAHLFCSSTGNTSRTRTWWADSGIVVFGTNALQEYRPTIYDSFLYDDNSRIDDYPSVLPIAYLGRIGTGDFCALNRDKKVENENPVVGCDHELPASDWKTAVIATSVEDWLQRMFQHVIQEKRFPEYWIGQDYSDATFEGYIEEYRWA